MSIAEIESTELALDAPTGGLWREAWFRLKRNPSAIVGAIFVLAFVVVAIFAPLIAQYPPEQIPTQLPETCCPGPSAAHWFGTNVVGQDTFSRIVYGARLSLIVGIVSVSVGLSVGMLLGAIAGYVGGQDVQPARDIPGRVGAEIGRCREICRLTGFDVLAHGPRLLR